MVRIYENKKTTLGNVVTSQLVLFAECPISLKNNMVINNFVEPVVDSSRYFVLRIEVRRLIVFIMDGITQNKSETYWYYHPVQEKNTKQHIFIGAGFRERQSAFDFRSTLQDFEKFAEREKLAKASPLTKQAEEGSEEEQAAAEFNEALSLKEGQKIKVQLKMNSSRHKTSDISSGVLLPPPVVKREVEQANASDAMTALPPPSATPVEEDDWGDFVEST